jgi:hypothetical protein
MDSVHATEEWRPVPGWPYEVSSWGRVKRTAPASGTRPGYTLTPRRARGGYHQITLCEHGRQRQVMLSVLICEVFHGPKPTRKHQVRHLNGVHTDDRAGNLKWGTQRENEADKLRHGTHQFGERNAMAKLTRADVDAIRAEFQSLGLTRWPRGMRSDVAKRYGVRPTHLRRIVTGERWP